VVYHGKKLIAYVSRDFFYQQEKEKNNNFVTDSKFHDKIYECITNLDNLNISSRLEINYNDSERKKLAEEFKSIRRKYYKEFKKKTFDLNIIIKV
jgi:hypothetical protein